MSETVLLNILIGLTTLCIGGFMFLLGWIMKMNTELEKRVPFEWAEENLARKDVCGAQMNSIMQDIKYIKECLDDLRKTFLTHKGK